MAAIRGQLYIKNLTIYRSWHVCSTPNYEPFLEPFTARDGCTIPMYCNMPLCWLGLSLGASTQKTVSLKRKIKAIREDASAPHTSRS